MDATLRSSARGSLLGSTGSRFAAGSGQLAVRSRPVGPPSAGRFGLLRPQAITKKELTQLVASRAPTLSKRDTEQVVEVTMQTIIELVASGEKVSIAGFGTFEPRDRSARKGRNPQTGEELLIAPTRVPAFSAAKSFKDAVKATLKEAAPAP